MAAEDYINFDFIDEEIDEDGMYVLKKKIELETEKAYRVRVEGMEHDELFWVPKSQVQIHGTDLIVPGWLNSRLDIQLDS